MAFHYFFEFTESRMWNACNDNLLFARRSRRMRKLSGAGKSKKMTGTFRLSSGMASATQINVADG